MSAADRVHAAGRLQESRVVDRVARQLAGDAVAQGRVEVGIRRAGAQQRQHVVLVEREQAVAQLTFGGEAQPVAGTAEGLGDRGDHADGCRRPVGRGHPGELEPLGRRTTPAAERARIAYAEAAAIADEDAAQNEAIGEHGLPLPCFIRGDDVEWGVRLHNRGVPTAPIPGIAVWHEPFYLKIGGWQLYYETRNALICAALHEEFSPRRVFLLGFKRLMTHLLTYRYYNAALVVRALEDAARGPALLQADPRALHAGLAELRRAKLVLTDALIAATSPNPPPAN